MHKTFSPKKMGLAGALARVTELASVDLVRVDHRVLLPHGSTPEHRLMYSYKESSSLKLVDESEIVAQVVVRVRGYARVEADDDASETGDDLFTSKVTHELRYTLSSEEPPPEDMAKAFAQINGLYNAWPYARSAISTLVALAGYPQLALAPLTISVASPKKKTAGDPNSPDGPEKKTV